MTSSLVTPIRPQIAIFTDGTSTYSRGILAGIGRYARMHGPWRFSNQPRHIVAPMPAFETWQGHGIIAQITTESRAERLASRGIPMVNVSGNLDDIDLPLVTIDNAAVGTMAAEYFIDRGFRHLACYTAPGHHYARVRHQAFEARAKESGLTCQSCEERRINTKGIGQFLQSLPNGTGLFAINDKLAMAVLEICQDLGIAIPEHLAVLGCDDDELVCDFVDPPLSSIAVNAERIGYLAAETLDRLMRGDTAVPRQTLVKPLGVVTRESSDIIAVRDRTVAAALRYIADHATDSLDVDGLSTHLSMSRRALEIRFARHIGRTPWQEIRRVQISRIKTLLAETSMGMAEIAARAGLTDARQLSVVFKRETGQTPTDFRRHHQ